MGMKDAGPIRFLVRDPTVCHTGELDECANVKYLSRIELTTRRGRDTRPTTEAEHQGLHQAQSGGAKAGGPGGPPPGEPGLPTGSDAGTAPRGPEWQLVAASGRFS